MLSCSTIFEASLPECVETIKVYAGLTALTDYTIFIEDKHGLYYSSNVTTDNAGAFSIDTTDTDTFPANLFNRYAGVFIITAINGYDTVDMTIKGQTYTGIAMSFQATSPQEATAFIGL